MPSTSEPARSTYARPRVAVAYKVVECAPKTEKSRRTVELDPATTAALRQHRAAQTKEMLGFGKQRTDDTFVFTREDGEGLHPQWLGRTLTVRARAAGLPIVRFHASATRSRDDGPRGWRTAESRFGAPRTLVDRYHRRHLQPRPPRGRPCGGGTDRGGNRRLNSVRGHFGGISVPCGRCCRAVLRKSRHLAGSSIRRS